MLELTYNGVPLVLGPGDEVISPEQARHWADGVVGRRAGYSLSLLVGINANRLGAIPELVFGRHNPPGPSGRPVTVPRINDLALGVSQAGLAVDRRFGAPFCSSRRGPGLY